MRKGIIYVYFNRAKYEKEGIEKYYVGQTIETMERRVGKDGKGYGIFDETCNSKFARSIRKWGWNAFEGRILEEVDEEDLNELEKFYIKYFDSYKNGYNTTLGGEGMRGYNRFEDPEERKKQRKRFEDPKLRKKISISVKKHFENPEEREKQSIMQKKHWEDKEYRKKMSEIQRKRWEDKNEREKISEAQRKRFESSEEREKISAAVKKCWKNQEYREKQSIALSEANKERYKDEKEREKISKSIKKHYEDSKAREKQSKAIKKRFQDPKEREKMSVIAKKRWEDPEKREKQSITQRKRFQDPKEKQKISEKLSGEKSYKAKSVYCKELNIIFSYTKLAAKYCKNVLNIKIGQIDLTCNGKRKSTGAYNGKKLHWSWIENLDKEILDNAEYIDSKKYEEIINEKMNN